MSTSEAYEYELSWTLALAVCRKMEGANRYEPLGPLRERPLAVRHLGEDHVSRIERQIFAAYSQTI
jgi:hypothetical protein